MINAMKQKEVMICFDAGVFKSCVISPAPLIRNGCILLLQQNKVGTQVLETQRGGERTFKTYDAAIAVAKEIGFRRIIIQLA
jgi:hypothetical protein